MGNPSIYLRPLNRFYIDILGPHPFSNAGYIGLLIVLDHLTKSQWYCPLKKFTSAAIQELTINHIYSALYSPKSNASERDNRSLIAGIRAYLKNDHRQWDEHLTSISCALRNSYHQSIGCSPYHALFGFDMITHASSYELLKKINLLNEPTVKLAKDDNLQLIRQDLRKHIKESFEKNQKQYNLRVREQTFTIGQEVYRRNFAQSNMEKHFNAKLSPVFLKARVREKLGSHYYVLEDMTGKLVGTFHAKDIRT